MKISSFIPAILWFIISLILLTVPGDNLPQSTLFNVPYFDKLVHLVMFFLLTTLFCFPFAKLAEKQPAITAVFNKIAFYVILYGIIMEFVQKQFTAGRSFDIADILFDAAGSFTGLWVMKQYITKKIGPNENRGRNQN